MSGKMRANVELDRGDLIWMLEEEGRSRAQTLNTNCGRPGQRRGLLTWNLTMRAPRHGMD
jgi:hypothetical protein